MTMPGPMRRLLAAAALSLAAPLAGCAAGPTWKEEVVMFDGSKVVVERQQTLGNPLDREPCEVNRARRSSAPVETYVR